MAPTPATYGSWKSPITVDVVVNQSISFKEVRVDPFEEGKSLQTLSKTISSFMFFFVVVSACGMK